MSAFLISPQDIRCGQEVRWYLCSFLDHKLSYITRFIHLYVVDPHNFNRECYYASSLSISRIANSFRQGRMANIGLERFVEALTDKEAGLTYPALTGIRKQSVQNVERLFGSGVIQFMDKHGYENEAKLLNVVRNWRRAIDERGLVELQRQEFLQDLMNYYLL